MSSRDRGPDEARPIPQHDGDDDAFVVDTRARGRGASDGRSTGSAQGDAYVVDTRRRTPRPGFAARSASARPVRRKVAPGMLYEEDRDYVAPGEPGRDGRGTTTAPRPPRPASTRPGAVAPQPTRRDAPRGPGSPGPGSPGPGGPPPVGSSSRQRRRRRRRTIGGLVALVVLAWIAFMVWVPFEAWNRVTKVDNIPAGDRPVDSAGYNYLLVGSDGRDGLTDAQKQELNAQTSGDIGKRTDSIILVHVPQGGGKSALISIPRDSYVPIPGYRSNKINAAYAFGGAKLLEQTIEQNTGIHLDGYIEIGFGGFASVVDSLGGVDVCVPFDMNDKDAAINLKKGCQTLNGPTALGFVRARKSDPRGDIGRAERQRQFLGAILKKALTPSTVLVPWHYKGFADAAAGGLEVGQDTGLTDAVRVLQTLRGVDGGDTLSLVVPISNAAYQTPNAGVAVKWDTEQAQSLFTAIKDDSPLTVPPAGTTGQ